VITVSGLGKMGRLGNQMFQYAGLRALAQKFNYSFCLPNTNIKPDNEDQNIFETFKLDNILKLDIDLYNITVTDDVTGECIGFDKNIFNKCPDNIDLHGYFQDIRYFQECFQNFNDYFVFKDECLDVAQKHFYTVFRNEPVISLHIRRGDYNRFPWHPMLSVEYYEKALMCFDKNLKVMVFGDDIDWCFQHSLFNDKRFFFSRNFNVSMDLCMQTFCQYHIISNSTLSWWGAQLANSKKVIKPKLWFAEHLLGYNDSTFLNVQDWLSL
jgi:hypothetical protein